jgi:hypothetical protein
MRGQYFSFDAIIASVIFVLALVALLSYWHSLRSFLDYQNDMLSRDAVSVSNLLFTPPEPVPTDCADMTDMERFGLAFSWDDRRVDSDILACAELQDSAWLKGVTGSSFNVYMKVTDLTDGSEQELGTSPADAAAGGYEVNDVVNMRRLATVVNTTDGTTHLAAFDLSVFR